MKQREMDEKLQEIKKTAVGVIQLIILTDYRPILCTY